jgi:hypothetical protein
MSVIFKQIANAFRVSPVLSTVETTSGKDGVTNFHNRDQWAEAKPRGAVRAESQQQFSINIWVGVVRDCVVDSHVLQQCLTGIAHSEMVPHHCWKKHLLQ